MTEPGILEDDPRLATLLQWRDQLIETGAISRSALKEAYLRLVLRSGRTDADQIRMMLPVAVAEHAGEMSRLLQDTIESAVIEDRDPAQCLPESDLAALDLTSQLRFAPYVFAAQTRDCLPISIRRIRHPDSPQDQLELSWPPYAVEGQTCVMYRVVSTGADRGYSPDDAQLVVATVATETIDDRPLVEAVRHLQVWVNVGESAAELFEAQPFLHASGVVIATLRDCEIREDSGRVVGNWSAIPGVRAVRVYRIPAELAERDGAEFRIATTAENLTGFADCDAERGCRYLYRMRCEVEVDGVVQLSEPVERQVAIPAVLEAVTDLKLTTCGPPDAAAFRLEWTAPRFGHVLVFRTPTPPDADARVADLDESVLGQVGLGRSVQLTDPVIEHVDPRGVRTSMLADVPWPTGWNRAYFTPVTILDGRALLGKTISTVRTGNITDVALLEYCSKQVLTFDWPDGAALVTVYITPKGHDPRHGNTGRSYEISLADYEKYGGMPFAGDLPNGGCALHLVPVAFSSGQRVLGIPTSIEYGGLLRLWYDVQIRRDPAGLPMTAALRIRAEQDASGSPPFVLVNNSDRLPLSISDGIAVNMSRPTAEGVRPSEWSKEFQWSALTASGDSEVWLGDLRGLRGWIRLFANLPPQRLQLLALLDPSVDRLRLTAGTT